MRLTCKTAIGYCDMQIATRENKLDKLGKLEDAEEICEKLENQRRFFRKYIDTNEIVETEYRWRITTAYNFNKKKIYVIGRGFGDVFDLDEYGITWAITKEELE